MYATKIEYPEYDHVMAALFRSLEFRRMVMVLKNDKTRHDLYLWMAHKFCEQIMREGNVKKSGRGAWRMAEK